MNELEREVMRQRFEIEDLKNQLDSLKGELYFELGKLEESIKQSLYKIENSR